MAKGPHTHEREYADGLITVAAASPGAIFKKLSYLVRAYNFVSVP